MLLDHFGRDVFDCKQSRTNLLVHPRRRTRQFVPATVVDGHGQMEPVVVERLLLQPRHVLL